MLPWIMMWLVWSGGIGAARQSAAEEAAAPRRHALLVGCTRYPGLGERRQLEGPGNDVPLVRRTLLERFHFEPQDIRVLTDAAGPEQWPTRAHVIRELQRLTDAAAAGDYVFILLAGHGSQQPDRDADPETDPEFDGLDEVFLPRDCGPWQTKERAIANALSDDELRTWLAAIVAKGAFVFFVADTCHAGTVSRGAEAVSRRVPPAELHVPAPGADSPAVRTPGGSTRPAETDWRDAARRTGAGSGLVALYAAQPHQQALEDRFTPGGPRFGRLCHTFCQVLEACDQPITYRELLQRIHWTFTQKGWMSDSTPGIEGTDLTREVLGAKTWPGRSQLRLSRAGDAYAVSGGVLHGITRGSVLAVYPAAGRRDQEDCLGYVRITDARPLSAAAESCAFNGMAARQDLPLPARCEVAYRELGELTLTLDVQSEGFPRPQDAQAARQQVRETLAELAADKDALLRLADEHQPSDWVAVATPDGVYVQRAGSSRRLHDPEAFKTGELIGPARLGAPLQGWFRDTLHGIARATNLRQLAEPASGSRAPLVDVDLSLTRDGQVFAPPAAGGAEVRAGERLLLQVRNRGQKAIAVAVFYIQNDFAIKPFFPLTPAQAVDNRIERGRQLPKPIGFDINDQTLGWEDVIVIAVDAADQATIDELQELRQAGFVARSRAGGNAPPAFRTPLGRLIDEAMNGGHRGSARLAAPRLDGYAIRRISWNVVRGGQP